MLNPPTNAIHPGIPPITAVVGIERLPRSFVFGEFLLQPERQMLLRGETPVRLGGRAFDILTALVERPGELVSKQELLAVVWPHIFVEESNLKANVATLRRALEDAHAAPRYIATTVGRGYRFIAQVRMFAAAECSVDGAFDDRAFSSSSLNIAAARGDGDGQRAVADVEFGEDRLHMRLDGVDR